VESPSRRSFCSRRQWRRGRGGARSDAGHELADAALRAEDLARFASLLAHEVRNPLSAVKIALQTLERQGTLAQNDLRRTSTRCARC